MRVVDSSLGLVLLVAAQACGIETEGAEIDPGDAGGESGAGGAGGQTGGWGGAGGTGGQGGGGTDASGMGGGGGEGGGGFGGAGAGGDAPEGGGAEDGPGGGGDDAGGTGGGTGGSPDSGLDVTCAAPNVPCTVADGGPAVCVDVQTDPKNCGKCGAICTDACTSGKCCGDGIKNGSEACDKVEFGTATCSTTVAPGWIGALACTAACKIDVQGCKTPATAWNAPCGSWTTFDVSTAKPDARGFVGGAFDGRYVYLAPHYNGAYHGVVRRFDTLGAFGAESSWSTFDVSTVNAGAKGFAGAAFDGRYVYLVPQYATVAARYDTLGAFDGPPSWTIFDVSKADAAAMGFDGAVFDGRYVYLVPLNGLRMARYDTKSAFDDKLSWSTFDVSTVSGGAKGYAGGGFDGRYVYLVPHGTNPYHGVVVRYDTQGSFGAGPSWSMFDAATVNPGAKGFMGAAFDGRYLYLVPHSTGFSSSMVARYDTQGAFGAAPSWSTFDVSLVHPSAKGFIGAAFDGRYVFLVPSANNSGPHGIVARYDTQGTFDAVLSWSTCDVSTVNAKAKGFQGAVFDGRFLYLVPYYDGAPAYGGVVARFDAKSPSWLPKGWNASFF